MTLHMHDMFGSKFYGYLVKLKYVNLLLDRSQNVYTTIVVLL